MLRKGSPAVEIPYNSAVKDNNFALPNFRSNVFICSSSPRIVPPLQAVNAGDIRSTLASSIGPETENSLVNRFRLGSLTDDGLSYKEKFVIRCYEVGINKTATIETIANLSQGRIGTRRDWIVKDYVNGEVIGRATSKSVMMNVGTRRSPNVNDDVRKEYLGFLPRTLRLAFPEENNSSLKKIAKLEDPADYSRLGLTPKRSYLDINNHVNNVNYIGWVMESIPTEIIDTHELQVITLDYRRECWKDDIVLSLTSREPLINDRDLTTGNDSAALKKYGDDLSRFLHLISSSENGIEMSRCRTEWRKKPAKR